MNIGHDSLMYLQQLNKNDRRSSGGAPAGEIHPPGEGGWWRLALYRTAPRGRHMMVTLSVSRPIGRGVSDMIAVLDLFLRQEKDASSRSVATREQQ
jgi:hypothetical protein